MNATGRNEQPRQVATAPIAGDALAGLLAQLAALCELLSGLATGPLEPLHLAVSRGRLRVSLTVDVAEARPAGQPATATAASSDPHLRRVHRQLLAVLTERPQSGKRIAAAAGYSGCNSYVQKALTELDRWEYARRTPDGYRLGAKA